MISGVSWSPLALSWFFAFFPDRPLI
jgi:hypothetical protein